MIENNFRINAIILIPYLPISMYKFLNCIESFLTAFETQTSSIKFLLTTVDKKLGTFLKKLKFTISISLIKKKQ